MARQFIEKQPNVPTFKGWCTWQWGVMAQFHC